MRGQATGPRFPGLVNLAVHGSDALGELGVGSYGGGVGSARVIVVTVCGHVCSEGWAAVRSIRVEICGWTVVGAKGEGLRAGLGQGGAGGDVIGSAKGMVVKVVQTMGKVVVVAVGVVVSPTKGAAGGRAKSTLQTSGKRGGMVSGVMRVEGGGGL